MKKRYCLKIIGILLCCCLSLGLYLNITEAKNATAGEQVDCTKIGNTIAVSLDSINVANAGLIGIRSFADEDIIMTVNGVPITSQEYEFRNMLNKAYPNSKNEEAILQSLIKEKAELSLALEQNLIPSEEEILQKIQMLREEDEANGNYAEKFCENTDLTIDEYWSIYDRYNIIRILIDENVFQYYLESEEIEEQNVYTAEEYEKISNDYLVYLENLVENAEIVYLK